MTDPDDVLGPEQQGTRETRSREQKIVDPPTFVAPRTYLLTSGECCFGHVSLTTQGFCGIVFFTSPVSVVAGSTLSTKDKG
jgi:hypothetical protein